MSQPAGQSCKTCRFHQMRVNHILDDGRVGYLDPNMVCKRNPPVIGNQPNTQAWFPVVAEWQWCGEYAPAHPESVSEGAATLARFVLMGDMSAARALADKLMEGDQCL